MASLFNYNTLQVSLKRETRTLVVELNRPEKENALNTEMIFELEGLLTWAASHSEIYSILLTSSSNIFSCGIDKEEAKTLSEEKFSKNLARLQKLVYSMFFLPQTIIVDLKEGAYGIGAELALGADIRIARSGTKINFNQLRQGFVPCSGGIGILSALLPRSFARQWILSSTAIPAESLLMSGFIYEFYTHPESLETLLQAIVLQAPVTRIQAKRSLLESIMKDLDHCAEFEARFSLAALTSGDWKKSLNGDTNFITPSQMARVLNAESKEAQIN